MDPVAMIVSAISGGTLLALAGVVYAAGKHVRSLEMVEEARRTEAQHLAQIPVLATRMTMVESSCATAVNEARATREGLAELKAEVRHVREQDRHVVSAIRPPRGPL